MRKSELSQQGRVSAATVFFVLFLVSLGLAAGLWVGQSGRLDHTILARHQIKPPETPPSPSPTPPEKSDSNMIMQDQLMDVAETAMPAVVNVFSEKTVEQSPMMRDPFFHFFFGPGRNKPRHERSLGSGVIVNRDGYILTNNHVVEDADEVKVALSDKREFEAQVVGTDPKTDVAVIKIEAKDLPVMKMGDSDKLRIGQVVLAIGNPFGLSQTVTMGIVSARGRSSMGITEYEDFIQTDAAINPGNSGGALINLAGELVGINTAIYSRSGGYMGIGFAIPVNQARHVMEAILQDGSVRRGFLGVGIQDLTPELAEQFDLDNPKGALVTMVAPESPADQAGFKAGDVIVAVDGKVVDDSTQLRNLIASYAPGSKVAVTYLRDGDDREASVTLAEQGAAPTVAGLGGTNSPERGKADFAGMTVVQLTPELADRLGIKDQGPGVVVTDVEGDSPAEQAGIQIGDVIVRVNRLAVNSVEDFKAAASSRGRGALIQLRRQGAGLFVVVPRQ